MQEQVGIQRNETNFRDFPGNTQVICGAAGHWGQELRKNLSKNKKNHKLNQNQTTTNTPFPINSRHVQWQHTEWQNNTQEMDASRDLWKPSLPPFLLYDKASCVGSCYYFLLHFGWTIWYQPWLFSSKLFSWVFEDCHEAHGRKNTLYPCWALSLHYLSLQQLRCASGETPPLLQQEH